jgi:signal transduction histidine kinase
LLGYEDYELIGMPVSKVMSLDEQLTHTSILGEGTDLYERILKRRDGSTLPAEISTTIVYNSKNEPAYIQSIARDISERKNAEKMLKKQARILSLISAATARLLQSSNIESRIPDVLEALGKAMDVFCCAIFEITTFSGKPSVDVQDQWLDEAHSNFNVFDAISPHAFAILSKGGNSYEASGENLFFGIVPIHGTTGLWKFLALFEARDTVSWSFSEREAIQTAANLLGAALQRNDYEEAIRLSETRNRIILSALPDLLIRLDVNGTILDYSTNPDHPLYIGDASVKGFETQKVVDRFMLPFSNSEYEARLYPIDSREALIVIRDIGEQLLLNQMKSDFINRASHELRTPVTSAILMTELIQEGGTEEELTEYWRTLRSELNRQKILIDRLLIAGRLESGMMKLEYVPIDIVPVLLESAQAVKPIANKRKVSIQLDPLIKPTRVIGDKSALEQVFINLFGNAAKFSPEGKSVFVKLSEAETEVTVSIVDQGLGIPPEAISHLFERFYRAKNVNIAEIPGSGIGLYIVKTIIDELGGRVEVISELNQGTTFVVTLKKA